MSWLAELAEPSGPRWSCGAYWAEDGAPSADDTDWADSTEWPKVYDPAAALRLGVYIGGDHVNDEIYSASWSLGNDDPFATSVTPSSCSLSLKASSTAAVNDRVVIVTEYDVLYVGTIEGVDELETTDRTTISAQATDDLTRATLAEAQLLPLGGSPMAVLDALLRAAGIVGRAWASDPDDHDTPAWDDIEVDQYSGSILGMISGVVAECVLLGAWTPAGLRVAPRWLEDLYPATLETLDHFGELQRSRSVQDLRTRWVVETPGAGWGAYDLTLDSAATYGERYIEVGGTEYIGVTHSALGSMSYFEFWHMVSEGGGYLDAGAFPDFGTSPPLRLGGKGRVSSRRHQLSRVLPYDTITDGPAASAASDRYRVLSIAHALTADDWGVSLRGIELAELQAIVVFGSDTVLYGADTVVFSS